MGDLQRKAGGALFKGTLFYVLSKIPTTILSSAPITSRVAGAKIPVVSPLAGSMGRLKSKIQPGIAGSQIFGAYKRILDNQNQIQ